MPVLQIVQLAGSLLVLTGFIAAQRGRLSTGSVPYLLLNLVGSTVLAVLALHESQWGFLLLEGVWAVVSGHGLAGVLRRRRPTAAR
jgi:uncharacterized membrane protein YccC